MKQIKGPAAWFGRSNFRAFPILVRSNLAWAVFALAATTSDAQIIIDSGTPDETSNRSIFFELVGPFVGSGQFAAQEFTLSSDATISQIEVYLGGSAANDDYHIFLTDAIGAGTGNGAVIDDYFVPPPGTAPNAGQWVGLLSANLSLDAGTYFIVYATDVAGTGGGFLPIAPPNNIGQPYLAVNVGLNVTEPYASEFFAITSTPSFGLRITAIPEPTTVLLTCTALSFMAYRRCSRAKPATFSE